MALNLIPLVLDLYDGGLNLISSGSATLVPSSQLNDVVDQFGVLLSPLTVGFHPDASPMIQIVPTDNENIQPSGWAWQITFNDVTGAPEPYYFNIAGSGTVFSFTATGPTFTAAGSSFSNGTGVVLTGSSLPGGFWPGTIYYVVGAAGDAFSLTASPGGSAIASTSTGSGEVTVVQYLSSLVSTLDVATVIPLSVAAGGTGSTSQNWQGLLTPVTVTQSSGSYAATAGALVKASISGGSWTVNLPNAPANNTIVGAKVMANTVGNANALTIACQGSDVFEQSGGSTSVTMSMPLQAAAWQYGSGYWTRLADDLPLGQLDNRYPNVFNVKMYGATGNDATADDVACQAAIAAASAAGGGIVWFPPGNYKLVTGLTMASKVTLRGAGGLVSILRPASGVTAITAAGTSGSQITQTGYEEIGITGPGQGTGSAPGMSLTWCTTGTRLYGLYIDLCGSDGIVASNTYSVSVRDCFLTYNGGNGLNAQNNTNSWDMSGNTSLGNTLWGYYIMGGAASILHDCDAESNGYGGAALLGTYSYTIEGGEYENNGASGGGEQCGIYVGTGTGNYDTPAYNTILRGNWLQGTSVADYGITVDSALQTSIESNGFQNNLTAHINVTSNATGTMVGPNNYLSTPASGNLVDAGTGTQQLGFDSTNNVMRSSGLSFGTTTGAADVTLTRAAAGRLAISGSSSLGQVLKVTNTSASTSVPNLYVAGTASTDLAVGTVYTGQSFLPWEVTAGGTIKWGSGSAGTDTTLSRSAAGVLSTGSALGVTGLTGATAASRYVGATTSGPPASGTFITGDWVIDQSGTIWICTSGGSPGTWTRSGQSLLTPVSVTQSSGTYNATSGSLVKATISGGSWTINLPQAPINDAIVAAKVMANATGNTNALTIACQGSDVFEQSGGGTSVTMSLPLQAAAWQYNGGYWTRVSDDLPLAQLDARYANVFSPMAYGAAGNGTTDDTAAVQAAFAAAHTAGGGTVDLGNYVFLTSSPIAMVAYISYRVVGGAPQGGQGTTGAIINNTSDVFTVPSATGCVRFENCAITASAGHIWNATSSSCSFWSILNTACFQSSNSHCIWYQPNAAGSAVVQAYSNMLVGDGCYFIVSGGAATIPPWYVITETDTNSNTWRRLQAANGSSPGVPFFYLESTGTTSSQLATDNVFEDITGELVTGGILALYSTQATLIRNVQGWDTTFAGDVFYIGTSSTGLQHSDGTTIINSGRRACGLADGRYDVHATSDTTNLVLINANPEYGATISLSVPPTTTIIPAPTVTAATYQNTGTGGSATTAVTTGNSGGSSGTAFSGVTGTVTFDSTEILTGGSSTLAYKFVGSASAAYVNWTVPNVPAAQLPIQYYRAYVYFTAFPTGVTSVFGSPGLDYCLNLVATGPVWHVQSPSAVTTGVTTPVVNTWYRVEMSVNQLLGTTTVRIYTLSGALIEQISATGGTYQSCTTAYFGMLSSYTGTFWLANLGWSNQGWLGP